MPFPEDLAQFFRPEDFGTAVVFSRTGATINGNFDSEFAEPFRQVQSAELVFLCPAASVPGVVQGDTLTAGAIVYKVRAIEPDGLGLVTLRLHK